MVKNLVFKGFIFKNLNKDKNLMPFDFVQVIDNASNANKREVRWVEVVVLGEDGEYHKADKQPRYVRDLSDSTLWELMCGNEAPEDYSSFVELEFDGLRLAHGGRVRKYLPDGTHKNGVIYTASVLNNTVEVHWDGTPYLSSELESLEAGKLFKLVQVRDKAVISYINKLHQRIEELTKDNATGIDPFEWPEEK